MSNPLDQAIEQLDAPAPDAPAPDAPAPDAPEDFMSRLDAALSEEEEPKKPSEPEATPKGEEEPKPSPEPDPVPKEDHKWKEYRVRTQEAEAKAQELADKVEQYEKKMAAYDLESTDAYKEAVLAKFDKIRTELDDVATSYGMDADDLAAALVQPDRRRQGEMLEEVTADLSPRDKQAVYRLADDYDAAVKTRAAMKADAAQTLSALREQEAKTRSAREAEFAQKREAADEKVFGMLKNRLPIFDGEEGEKLAEQMRKDAALSDPSSSPENLVLASYATLALPKMVHSYAKLQKEVDSLKEALKKVNGSVPRPGETPPSPGSPGPEDFLGAVEARLNSIS